MIGIILAAGAGRRLKPLTNDLPKTLLLVDDDRTLFDLALENLRAVDVADVVVVTGFAAQQIEERLPEMEERFGLRLQSVFNPEALTRNNAYSLWLAREHFSNGALIVNGDTLHPVAVTRMLVDYANAPSSPFDIALAVDQEKRLSTEEMKVVTRSDGSVVNISKQLDADTAFGEYIGVCFVAKTAATKLAEALESTWRRDPDLYYEDGFQELIDRDGVVTALPIGDVDWIEVDEPQDLERARTIRCPS